MLWHWIFAVIGVAVVVTTWLSVLRTVFTPRFRSSLVARKGLALTSLVFLTVARGFSGPRRERLLDLCAPVTLFLMAAFWLASAEAGFVILDRATGSSAPVEGLAWGSVALMLTAFTCHLVRFTDAYSRRERMVAMLDGEVAKPSDAEEVLAANLRTGSRGQLNDSFAEWAGWISDIRCTHIGYPALIYMRKTSKLSWIRAAVIALDAAALTLALAPDWAPPQTRAFLNTGIRCMRELCRELGVVPLRAVASLQGREEIGFDETVRLAQDAGLPTQAGDREAWEAFQQFRAQYAPHATWLAERLLYENHYPAFLDDEVENTVTEGPPTWRLR
ncbi:hypothetical protein J4573_16835 [Actinomadura barringtoniae]|uniref:Uncharacterized protein n=1 Tax=Actinomadura barringtoniae TaxID=1427535 RepID=A0A939PHR6_9ACTN|nr:hypothetical protein [Actinomadura barringtoniae]MBO2448771.1 hypothetical protein [Actinomadura barringtoniae]